MSELLTRGPTAQDELTEQAQRAVAAFRKLQPTLSAYARAISKNPHVSVEMATRDNGSTDGTRIFYRPPLALGDPRPHERRLCDKRGEYGLMLCPACEVRELVLVTVYHEIAHIAGDSFAQITDNDKRKTIEFAIKEIGGKWSEGMGKRLAAAPFSAIGSYLALAQYVNEYLPYLVNCLEDARVNSQQFEVRKGLRKMFEADVARVFRDGFENREADGTFSVHTWHDAPLNSQVSIGVFCKASGYDYSGWFAPEVIDALNDSKLTALTNQMPTIRSASAVYNLSLKILARLRDLGYLGTKEDPDQTTPPEECDDGEDSDAPDDPAGSPDPDGVPDESEQSDQQDPAESESDAGEGEEQSNSEGDASSPAPEEEPESGSSEGDSSEEGDVTDGKNEGSDSSPAGDSDDAERSDDSDGDNSPEGSDSDQPGADGDEGDGDRHGDGDSGMVPDEDRSESTDIPDDASSASDEQPDSPTSDESLPADGSSVGSVPGGDGSDSELDDKGDSEGIAGLGESRSPSDSQGDETGLHDEEHSSLGSEDMESGETDPSQDDSEGDVEPIDSGADDGYGGTEVLGSDDETGSDLDYGTPDDLEPILLRWMGHEEKPHTIEEAAGNEAISIAVIQGIYFTTPSTQILGVREHHFGNPVIQDGENYSEGWSIKAQRSGVRSGKTSDLEVPEQILQPALLHTRRTFSDNQRGGVERNKKSGRVNSKVLGRRAGLGDPRLFEKRTQPGKKDYFVVIGVDISYSTVGVNLALEKRAVMAQAELLDRVGIPFAIYAHTGNYHDSKRKAMDLDVYHIKGPKEKWDNKTINRLEQLGPCSANLDGHAMEFLRKRLDESRATDKILLYYSDGKMPAENGKEELVILRREISICRNRGYTLLGVGIRTDSPARHGLETVQVDEDKDLVNVVQLLGKRLAKKG